MNAHTAASAGGARNFSKKAEAEADDYDDRAARSIVTFTVENTIEWAQKSGKLCRLVTLGEGGVGGHEDDEDDDGGDVGFRCRKNNCSVHTYDNSAESDSLIDISSRGRTRRSGQS